MCDCFVVVSRSQTPRQTRRNYAPSGIASGSLMTDVADTRSRMLNAEKLALVGDEQRAGP